MVPKTWVGVLGPVDAAKLKYGQMGNGRGVDRLEAGQKKWSKVYDHKKTKTGDRHHTAP